MTGMMHMIGMVAMMRIETTAMVGMTRIIEMTVKKAWWGFKKQELGQKHRIGGVEKGCEPAKSGQCATGRGACERTRSPRRQEGPHPSCLHPPTPSRRGQQNYLTLNFRHRIDSSFGGGGGIISGVGNVPGGGGGKMTIWGGCKNHAVVQAHAGCQKVISGMMKK